MFLPLFCFFATQNGFAQEKRSYKIFQFPANQIPRIDGNADDWSIVPDSYTAGMDQLWDDSHKHEKADPNNLDARVKVGWVKGMDRLYFLYEAYDDYWDFSLPDLHNDTFELVVDDVSNKRNNGFWNLSQEHTMYGNASFLLPFKLMPKVTPLRKNCLSKIDWNIYQCEIQSSDTKYLNVVFTLVSAQQCNHPNRITRS